MRTPHAAPLTVHQRALTLPQNNTEQHARMQIATLLAVWLCLVGIGHAAEATNAPPPLPAPPAIGQPLSAPPPLPAPTAELPPGLGYEKPSSEMDFDVPPLTTPAEDISKGKAPTGIDPVEEMEHFFSGAPRFDAPPTLPEAAERVPVEIEKEAAKPRKRSRAYYRVAPRPPFRFKSIRLPSTIYKKAYRKENRHLPVALYDNELETAAKLAAAKGDVNLLKALRHRGFNAALITPANPETEPPLVAAARHGKFPSVHWLLRQGGDADQANNVGFSALHFATYRHDVPMVKLLLAHGANPYRADNESGITPWMIAEANGSEEILTAIREFAPSEDFLSLAGHVGR